MAVKSYTPVRVVDPAEGHLLPLLPSQDFVLVLNDPDPEVEIDSAFFEISYTEYSNSITTIYFRQKYDLRNWGCFSRVFLGNISILTGLHFGSVHVFLESADRLKSRVMTVVNPNQSRAKVDPQALLEVVVFDDCFYSDRWECTIIAGDSGLKYEQFEYQKFDPFNFDYRFTRYEANNLCFGYPRANLLLTVELPIFEHHYWFRLDRASIVGVSHMMPGTYGAGKLIFDTDEENAVYRVLDLHVRVKNKHKLSFLENCSHKHNYLLQQHQTYQSYRRYAPRDSLYKQNVYLRKKEDTDLHSHRVIYSPY